MRNFVQALLLVPRFIISKIEKYARIYAWVSLFYNFLASLYQLVFVNLMIASLMGRSEFLRSTVSAIDRFAAFAFGPWEWFITQIQATASLIGITIPEQYAQYLVLGTLLIPSLLRFLKARGPFILAQTVFFVARDMEAFERNKRQKEETDAKAQIAAESGNATTGGAVLGGIFGVIGGPIGVGVGAAIGAAIGSIFEPDEDDIVSQPSQVEIQAEKKRRSAEEQLEQAHNNYRGAVHIMTAATIAAAIVGLATFYDHSRGFDVPCFTVRQVDEVCSCNIAPNKEGIAYQPDVLLDNFNLEGDQRAHARNACVISNS